MLPFGFYAQARSNLSQVFAMRMAAIWVCATGADHAAQYAALEAEEKAALKALADEWAARRVEARCTFGQAKAETTGRTNIRAVRPARRRRVKDYQFRR
jgi:hypothetical protein